MISLHHRPSWLGYTLAGLALMTAALPTAAAAVAPNLVLITLDTTRNDFVGAVGAQPSRTPVLDRLAIGGVRYRHALTPVPLTLPAHASLLTGVDPPEHGLRDNGSNVLPEELPTLATVLADRGYRTIAVVASRVLDRRFGLARGFTTYDDRMVAEKTGEYGFPERDATAVTTAALASLDDHDPAQPFFLWVHYYDPHFPYAAPDSPPDRGAVERYGDEIAFVDGEIGRLLAGLPQPPAKTVVAVVGDHGESLGEHGEPTHGLFVYRSVLEVPLILAGPGVPKGRVIEEVVGIRRLGATVLRLVSPAAAKSLPGVELPGLGLSAQDPAPEPVYSETLMPRSVYGWSPLTAITDGRYRLIVAPRPELYDVVADPAEATNLVRTESAVARRLRDRLARLEAGHVERRAKPAPADGRLAAELRSLGYLAGAGSEGSGLDPKDGVLLLARQVETQGLLSTGQTTSAIAILQDLNEKSPGNVPFLVRLASAQQSAGQLDAAIATFRRAVQVQPKLEFLHHHLGRAYFAAGQLAEAETAFRGALAVDPRFAPAWLSLAELAHHRRRAAEEREILLQAVAAETDSLAVFLRLIQIDTASKSPQVGELLERASELAPEIPSLWLQRGRWHLEHGEPEKARAALDQVIRIAPASAAAAEARSLLARIAG